MRRIYKKIEAAVLSAGDKLLLKKLQYSEWNAIFKKRRLYAHITWSEAQNKEFADFFKNHYGRIFSNRWHKLYQSINGKFCAQYFPEILYTTKLEKILNPSKYCEALSDKSLRKTIWNNIPGLRNIHEYLTNINGLLCDSDGTFISEKSALEMLHNIGRVCIKPTTITGSGKNVNFFNFQNGKDENSSKTVKQILQEYNVNYVVQELLLSHESYSRLHSYSINTIRLTTYICNNSIQFVPLTIRVGSSGNNLDNIHAGGIGLGINQNGQLLDKGYRLGYADSKEIFEVHPDTKVKFAGHQLACIPKMCKVAEKLHQKTPQLGIISWDFIVDTEEQVILIEANLSSQGIWFPQIANAAPAFGDNTAHLLELIAKQ